MTIKPEWCEILAKASEEESRKIGIDTCFSIVDESAVLMYFKRMPDAILASMPISQNKAYTAVAMKMPTGDLKDVAAPGGSLFGLNTADPRVVIFGGGFPLVRDGQIIGGIGISGGSVEEDEQIGHHVLSVFDTLK